jgi:uncharacterized membrane-anchored protein
MSRHFSKFALGILIAALLQSAALTWMVYDRVSLLKNGREVVVKSVPVDPRDLFRGEYVILNYEISTLDLAVLAGDDSVSNGQTVYVTLEPDQDGIWHAVSIHKSLPTKRSGAVSLRATGTHAVIEDNSMCSTNCMLIVVQYAVGKMFVPEGEGKKLENLRNSDRLQVVLAVADDGNAVVKALIVDGKRIFEETLF